MKPSLGRIVLFHGVNPAYNNGSSVCPAVIVRVWSDTCVNLRLLRDGTPDSINFGFVAEDWKTSVVLDESKTQPMGWSWPERV